MTGLTINNPDVLSVANFIKENWRQTVRTHTADDGTLIGLPHPYTIPCRAEAFQELYYWDTYFTCVGLLRDGLPELALANTRNLLEMLCRFGFVPNGNRTYYLSRSQPPYLAPLVALVSGAHDNTDLLAEALPLLAGEHTFWTTKRQTAAGLSHYGNHATTEQLIEFFPTVRHRAGHPDSAPEENLQLASTLMSECESGWDLTSRYERRCADFCPVDLNTNLFLYESLLARWTSGEESRRWRQSAAGRKDSINALCWNQERGAWLDYDHANQQPGRILTAATFHPLWAGLADRSQASQVVEKALPILEHAHGVSPVDPARSPGIYQWDHPNVWPAIQHIVWRGLSRYGYHDDARRIAEKYVVTVTKCFHETGDLWEKYNALDGTHETVEEAGYLINPTNMNDPAAGRATSGKSPPAMMGWTAGTYLDALALLSGDETMPSPTPGGACGPLVD